MTGLLTPESRAAFDRDGYLLVPGLFSPGEVGHLRAAMEQDPAVRDSLYERRDAQGKATRIALWNEAGDSVYGLAARSERVVHTVAGLLEGEVYHYHSKLTAKEPYEGGAWEWHQDYGYWYHNGCLYPTMASVMVALDRCTPENGCLQVIRGSHRAGRINHSRGGAAGEQVGAELERVEQLLSRHERVHVAMEPGDGLFFHGNLMHRSDQNRSPDRRWTLLFCYNRVDNAPFVDGRQALLQPLATVPDDAVEQAGVRLSDPASMQFQVRREHSSVPLTTA
ncbi:MAG: phytanoyl-CoA dioxygenase family protein [Rhodoferax sp.]|nr:phytanoyl-CoA dioxygenase family protein [Rhodoferax sp.]